ncbi:MAG: M20/M25/M40 family metallo-hydrolase, partial [Chitinophagaceae bacterium]
MLSQKIKELAAKYSQEFIGVRHHLHANPELSYKEYKTSKFVQEKLKSIGIPFQIMADTGVVGIIEGKDPSSRIIALRADMDALPVGERVNIPFASKVTAEYNGQKVGVMHACGHDAHTAMLMG